MPLRVDPLGRANESLRTGKLPPEVFAKIQERLPVLADSVAKVEKAAELSYPPYYIQPLLILVRTPAEVGVTGIYYARNVPLAVGGRLHLFVEFTAPLVLYASKKSVLAVAAHEFAHYVELVRRFSSEPTSVAAATTMFEATYRDMMESVPPAKLFGRFKSLSSLIDAKFEEGFVDEALNQRTLKYWYQQKLPTISVSPDDNSASIPMEAVLNADFDQAALDKIKELEN